jgi:hypothetical protein
MDGAIDSCRAILGVARSIGDEPFLISAIMRVAIGNNAMHSARRVLAQGEPSDVALSKLQSDILDELAQPILLQAMTGERAILDEIIRRVRDGEIAIESLSDSGSSHVPPFPLIAPWGKLLFDNQRAVGLEWMNGLVAISREPPFKRSTLCEIWKANVERVTKSRLGPYVATLPLLMVPAIRVSEKGFSRYQGELGAMAILLAAERQRGKTGDWPASIAAIDPAILADPPVDPFSGECYRLDRSDRQFLVHSIGTNLKDEHGEYDSRTWLDGGPDDIGTSAWDVPLRRQPPLE